MIMIEKAKKIILSVILAEMAAVFLAILSMLMLTIANNNNLVAALFSVAVPLGITYICFPLFLLKMLSQPIKIKVQDIHWIPLSLFVIIFIASFIVKIAINIPLAFSFDEWISLLITYAAVAVAEEFLYRKTIQKTLKKADISVWIVLLIQAVIFAFVNHSGGDFWINCMIRFPAGFILGWLKNKTGTIWWGVSVHYCYNLFVSMI